MEIKEDIIFVFTQTFQKCSYDGAVSEDWKLENVRHVFKKGNENRAEKYSIHKTDKSDLSR